MFKVVIGAAVLSMVMCCGLANADEMSKDEMAKDGMAKDSMSKDSMGKDSMSKEKMGKGKKKGHSTMKGSMEKTNGMSHDSMSK